MWPRVLNFNLFYRSDRLADHPGEGCDLLFEVLRPGRKLALLEGIRVAFRSAAAPRRDAIGTLAHAARLS